MLRFGVNLSWLFTEYPLLERFDHARRAGFEAVELSTYPFGEDPAPYREALARNGLELVLINLPVGDPPFGRSGIASHPGQTTSFREKIKDAAELFASLGCQKANCLLGLRLEEVPYDVQWRTALENVRFAADTLQQVGIKLTLQPVNTFSVPGFLVPTPTKMLTFLAELGHPNAWLQFDTFQTQRMEGNLIWFIRQHIDTIGHIQISDSPDRSEPGTGEINIPNVLRAIEAVGYDDWVCLEYTPTVDTRSSLQWLVEAGYWAIEP
jgi:hydroxypyruvate isomerase